MTRRPCDEAPAVRSRGERRNRWLARGFLAALGLLVAFPATIAAQQTGAFFQQNCKACHTIGGGRLVGPDLKDVTQRKDRDWLVRFVQNPKAMMDARDPYALRLQQDAKGIVMPTVPGMNPAQANALLDYIEAESKSGKAPAGGLAISDQLFTAADVAEGRKLFLGVRPLANGGPSCISCHTVGTLGGLGGGRLGPDLTLVYERLGGRKAVGGWLTSPPTPTMQAVFRKQPLKPEEIPLVLAFIEDVASQHRTADSSSLVKFFLLGFCGMFVGLVVLQAAWRGRFHAVRRLLVRGRDRGER